MNSLKTVLITMTAIIISFTAVVVWQEGLDLITPFLTAMISLSWQGQFNVDFSFYLILSGIWMAWRTGFTKEGIALGILAPPLGIMFFAPFLIYLIASTDGDVRKLLLGVHSSENTNS